MVGDSLAEGIEPERSNPSGWLTWVAVLAGMLAVGLVYTLAATGGDRTVSWTWLLAGVGALIMAALALPAWAIFGLEES